MSSFRDWLKRNAPEVHAEWRRFEAAGAGTQELRTWAAHSHQDLVKQFYGELGALVDSVKRSEPWVGLPSDELLKMRGRAMENMIGPTQVEEDHVVWHYPDLVVTLAHYGGQYRVAEVTKR